MCVFYCSDISSLCSLVHYRAVHFTANLKSLCSRYVSHKETQTVISYYENYIFVHLCNNFCFLQDFDVGKSYKKKILLTNISYTQNFCKYVGMSHILKDFIEVL